MNVTALIPAVATQDPNLWLFLWFSSYQTLKRLNNVVSIFVKVSQTWLLMGVCEHFILFFIGLLHTKKKKKDF